MAKQSPPVQNTLKYYNQIRSALNSLLLNSARVSTCRTPKVSVGPLIARPWILHQWVIQMNLSRKHGKHTWRRYKVVCVSACRHRSAQPLKIKCILLLKKNHSTHSCLFWLSLPHLLLSCFVIFLVLTEHAGSAFSYVCRVPRRDLCPPPPFFFFQGCIEPKSPVTMQSDTSLGLHGALLSQLSNTSPRAAARPWWVLQVADVRATRPRAQHALIFPKTEAPNCKIYSHFTSFSPFSPLHKALLSVTEGSLRPTFWFSVFRLS